MLGRILILRTLLFAFGIFCSSLFVSGNATAGESFNGHRFISLCLVAESDYDSEHRFAECERFVREVREVLGYQKIHGQRACIPGSVSDIQLLIAGIAGLEARHDQQDREAHAVLAEIFSKRWPCSE